MNNINSIRILSRKSKLAVIQARLVGKKIKENFPYVKITYLEKKTSGDIDLKTPLSEMGSAGVFTDDLRNDLISNKCDLAVHSWKDLPLDLGSSTILAGSLKRADQRDILFIKKNRKESINKIKVIKILSSSPRRIYNLKPFIKDFLPFKLEKINFENIRGNITSRFKKFLEGDADGLVMAKAAVDRLLNNHISEFDETSEIMRKNIEQCLWTITPLSQNPTSPAQGALGLEVSKDNKELIDMIIKISDKQTVNCVNQERNVLKDYGGGCHQKIGVSYFVTHFGMMKVKKGETEEGVNFYEWKKNSPSTILEKKISEDKIYPSSLKNYNLFERQEIPESLETINKISNHCIWVARSSALPIEAKINSTNIVWTSGIKTWKSLSKRGIWVNGTSDGMGEEFDFNIDNLTSNSWIKLTHTSAHKTKIKKVIYTYSLKQIPIEESIQDKTFFYWMSSSAFHYVLKQYPEIINQFHACGPGNTYEVLKKVIKDKKRLEVVLSYDVWKNNLLKNNLYV